jgi:hypothetical protein
MKKLLGMLIPLVFVLDASASFAAPVEVEWKNPDKYQDIKPGSTQSKKTFRKRLFRAIEKSFAENMEKIPSGYNLKVTVFDVDLAGKINHGLANEIRTINDHDFPRLHFYIILENEKGDILLQGEQNLKERKDKHASFRMRGSQKEFYLETMLIDKWFDKALVPGVSKI